MQNMKSELIRELHCVGEKLPAKVTQEILENLSMYGTAPLTQASLKETVGGVHDQIVNSVHHGAKNSKFCPK